MEGLYFHCSLSVCLYVCVSVCPDFLWTKFQPNGCTDLDAIFAKLLLIALAQTLLKLMTFGQRSRSRWPKIYVKMIKKKFAKNSNLNIFEIILIIRLEILLPSFWYQIWPYCTIINEKFKKKVLLTKNILRGCELTRKTLICLLCNCANQLLYRGLWIYDSTL